MSLFRSLFAETFRLKINVTSERCTAGLNDRGSSTYLIFKYQIENAVMQILNDVPGDQLASLVDIRYATSYERTTSSNCYH